MLPLALLLSIHKNFSVPFVGALSTGRLVCLKVGSGVEPGSFCSLRLVLQPPYSEDTTWGLMVLQSLLAIWAPYPECPEAQAGFFCSWFQKHLWEARPAESPGVLGYVQLCVVWDRKWWLGSGFSVVLSTPGREAFSSVWIWFPNFEVSLSDGLPLDNLTFFSFLFECSFIPSFISPC